VAVSAVGPSGVFAPYSSFGKELDIAAPGGDKSQGEKNGILQQTIDPSQPSHAVYAYYQGTSMAAPHVAGAAALLFSAGAKNPDQVEKALFAGAEASGTAWNERTGHGVLNVEAALEALDGKLEPSARPEVAAAAAANGANTSAALDVDDGFTLRAAEANGLSRFLIALVLAIGVAFSLRKRERGTLSPALLTALMLSAAGIWFLPKPGSAGIGAMAARFIEIPIPDWGKWLFGPGRASPLFYSALIPLALTLLGFFWKAARPVMSGVCIGFAAFLAYCAWSGAPAIAWMPLRIVALPWLLVNLGLCLLFGRALMRKEAV
jgi:serine protease